MNSFAFVFPGQGSQAVGMLDAWGEHPAVLGALAEASDALGEDLGKLIHEGPKEALALTTNTQPVMLVAGVAAWRAWLAEGGAAPSVVAGHSLGEYSALAAAGSLSISDTARLLRKRFDQRAREIGLTQSRFSNSTGIHEPDHVMTVRELAKLAQHIIKTYPDYYKIYGEREFTYNKIRQFNRNPLLNLGIGADGMPGLAQTSRAELDRAAVIYGSRRQLDLLDDTVTAPRREWPSPMLSARMAASSARSSSGSFIAASRMRSASVVTSQG